MTSSSSLLAHHTLTLFWIYSVCSLSAGVPTSRLCLLVMPAKGTPAPGEPFPFVIPQRCLPEVSLLNCSGSCLMHSITEQ